jgi:hypothetical protein
VDGVTERQAPAAGIVLALHRLPGSLGHARDVLSKEFFLAWRKVGSLLFHRLFGDRERARRVGRVCQVSLLLFNPPGTGWSAFRGRQW